MGKQHGFTLIELMVTLAVVAITVAVGGPKISQLMQGNRYTATLNYLSAHISYARSEAVKRSTDISIASLNGNDAWEDGWRVFIDVNGDGFFNAGDTSLRIFDNVNLPNTTIRTGGNRGLTYDQLGVLTPVGAVTLALFEKGDHKYDVSILPLGSVNIEKIKI